MNSKLNIGILGAGGFANFAAKSFLKVEGIKIIAVSDIDEVAAKSTASDLNAKVYLNYQDMLQDDTINLIYIATPPFLHYSQSKLALEAGKHVICEKPAAIKTEEAEELAAYSKSKELLYVVNLMQRYNSLYKIVDEIIKENVLGEFLHGFFENYASDEKLSKEHWFWDEIKSGGIFIEHGVHFFDMFEGWLGAGTLVNAIQSQRPNISQKIVDRVQATVSYKDSFVNFYHGFNQPKILDRQELRLQFEKGDITLFEWVPVKMRINALLSHQQRIDLESKLGDCTVKQHNLTDQEKQESMGNFKAISFDEFVTIDYGTTAEKANRYEEIVIAMITDQWQWIKDKSHSRIITEDNAVKSLRLAEAATKAAIFI
jgi:predicted dehydrogenase